LFDFTEEMELEENDLNCMFEYLISKYNLNTKDYLMINNFKINEKEKFISLFILSIKNNVNICEEIQKIKDYERMKILLEKDDMDEAQNRIQENYKNEVENYLSIYSEAKKDFEKHIN
jgi:hypothetical protein